MDILPPTPQTWFQDHRFWSNRWFFHMHSRGTESCQRFDASSTSVDFCITSRGMIDKCSPTSSYLFRHDIRILDYKQCLCFCSTMSIFQLLYLITWIIWCFSQISIFSHYVTLLFDDDRMQLLLARCFSVCYASVPTMHVYQLTPTLWCAMTQDFCVRVLFY